MSILAGSCLHGMPILPQMVMLWYSTMSMVYMNLITCLLDTHKGTDNFN